MEHLDVLIVGAGLSGIGAAWHLQKNCPGKHYAILEARATSGGTWDLFRYPGVRSDSDMHTLGYRFKPWVDDKSIADGPTILSYVRETAQENGIEQHIRYGCRVLRAEWSSSDALWTVRVEQGGKAATLTAAFVIMCSGYYSYAEGHNPDFPGAADFAGRIVHPQFWPDDLHYDGMNITVIGSGATAVTLVPALADLGAHVTMLQRSPSYVASRPEKDVTAIRLRRFLPEQIAYGLTRWKNVLLGSFFFRLARKKPVAFKQRLIGMVRDQLGPDYDVDTHFTPRYNPWDQRLCAVPDGDLFRAIRAGKAEVVTDTIDTFTPDGIRLASGRELTADVIVTATGLKMNTLGDVVLTVDGVAVDVSKTMAYKGMMFSNVPNIAYVFGYTNASWTLKADLTADYVCRVLNYMDRRGVTVATPRRNDPNITEEPFLDFSSGYVTRAADILPKQGSKKPWKLHQNYFRDLMALKFGKIDDGTLKFSNPARAKAA
ncbi:NAD(P)/FAD-dependent oxidoreductase [Sphingomonas paeninsulae]|jgi:monooxygenase|uniref:NAD(P)/FAD-dependent oxidoreductase n=1 Tax=Sphingomonas paeninsulae TaxID=2319844 RepID=A0A494TEX8_SPHPE|nr:NAD(P)/FAD-dependent oxidoreductase [Sphingomonas paeninsulae]AYJ85563.1 NAD(P)/FAD-dependent oxidoreductase [Sphingomonas paeninsulae]